MKLYGKKPGSSKKYVAVFSNAGINSIELILFLSSSQTLNSLRINFFYGYRIFIALLKDHKYIVYI